MQWFCICICHKRKLRKQIIDIRIMADAIIADSKHRIWLMLDDVPVLAVDYLLSLQINAMSAEDMYKISPTV